MNPKWWLGPCFLWASLTIATYALYGPGISTISSNPFDALKLGLNMMVFPFTSVPPLWFRILFVYPLSIGVVLGSTTFIMGMLPLDLETEAQTAVEASTWPDYGQRLKLAYASKFGYENKGFDDEVDMRINVMLHNGRGWTRMLAKNWLKRMHRFVEAP